MSRPPLACEDRSGFLFAHACDRPAAGACSVCGKAICMQHTRMQSGAMTCIGCMRADRDDDDASDADDEVTRADDPYFFPGADRAAYYDADDRAAFEQPRGAEAEEGVADIETDTGAS